MNSIRLIILLFIASSCALKVATQVTKRYDHHNGEVRVYGLSDQAPASEELGTLRLLDTGFTTNCIYDSVLVKAKREARKIGGNAIKITEHKLPSTFGSTCHQIAAKILRVDNFEAEVVLKDEKTLGDVNYAILHVYRPGGMGAVVGYDLYLGSSLICRVKNNRKESIKIQKDGRNTVWAKTESKTEIPINIDFGKEYYVRCGIKMGAFVGRPTIQLVDYATGKTEFALVNLKNK